MDFMPSEQLSNLMALNQKANIGATAFNALGSLHNMFYNAMVQRKTWDREDSAIQRRVADAKASGLSPLSVLGQGANSGQIVNANHSPVDMSQMNSILADRLNRELQREQMAQQDRFHSGELSVAQYNAETERLRTINDLVTSTKNLELKDKELKAMLEKNIWEQSNALAQRDHEQKMLELSHSNNKELEALRLQSASLLENLRFKNQQDLDAAKYLNEQLMQDKALSLEKAKFIKDCILGISYEGRSWLQSVWNKNKGNGGVKASFSKVPVKTAIQLLLALPKIVH